MEESKEKPPLVAAQPGGAKPAVAAPQSPPAARPPPPTPRPAQPSPAKPGPAPGRRNFLKALFAVGAILSMVPFVPWGTFLSSTVATTSKRKLGQPVVVDDLPKLFGSAAGKKVNVNDLQLFPPNGHWVVTYPTSGSLLLDAENPDTFQKFELVRLPESLGGASKQATDFVAFSKVCVHLWCSPNYNPASQEFACPCHGSTYQLPKKDPITGDLLDAGKAIAGPAFLQQFPTNAIPMLTLQADSAGNLYIFYPNRDPSLAFPNDQVDSIEANGDLGFGRDYKSYQNFIVPKGKIQADPKELNQVVG